MKKVIMVIFPLFLMLGCQSVPTYQDPASVDYEIEGSFEIDQDIEEAVKVVEDNLRYAEEKDMDGYLSTIIPSGREETKQELEPFFEEYDMEHTILNVKVLEKEEDIMLLQVEQQTIALDAKEGAPNYRDHIAEANHTMIKEDGKWLIKETVITDNFYLE